MGKNFFADIKHYFVKDEMSVLLHDLLGFFPTNSELYKLAFIHRSYSIKNSQGKKNNERLEFLGDAVLNAIITDILYKYFPKQDEGFLTKVRSQIVSRESLNQIAQKMGLERFVIKKPDDKNVNAIGNAFEAIVCAIYLDKGYDFTKQFVEKKIINHYLNLEKIIYSDTNYKSRLLEWSQKKKKKLSFKTKFDSNAAPPSFVTETCLDGVSIGTGKGKTKKESQQEAARVALNYVEDFEQISR